jgi:hypothetical protein
MTPTLEPLWHKASGELGYRLSIEGASKSLFFKRAELEALQLLISTVLEDRHDRLRT